MRYCRVGEGGNQKTCAEHPLCGGGHDGEKEALSLGNLLRGALSKAAGTRWQY